MSCNYHYLFKYILVGDSNVGKSSLLLRFIDERYIENYQPTLGVEFGSRNFSVQNLIVRAMIWDTAGQQTFKSIIKTYYRGAIIALLIFDVTNVQSFTNLIKWTQEIRSNSHQHIRISLVANKIDLTEKRQVSFQTAKQFANTHQYSYIEVSAKTGLNVYEVFANPAYQLIQDLLTKKIIVNPHLNIGIKVGCPQSFQLEHSSTAIELKKKNKQNSQCRC